jgi:hypothetical protein
MVIRVASQTKNTNNSGQKNICVICAICATIKNQREEINQCEIKKPNHYEEQDILEIRNSNSH